MSRHPYVVDVFGELISCPFVLAIQFCEYEITDWVAVIGSVLPVDHRIVAVDSHRTVVMRD